MMTRLAFLMLPVLVLAQQGGMMEGMDGMGMCPGCGAGGWLLLIAWAAFLVAGTAAMIALTVFLVRRSRPRPPLEA